MFQIKVTELNEIYILLSTNLMGDYQYGEKRWVTYELHVQTSMSDFTEFCFAVSQMKHAVRQPQSVYNAIILSTS
jgi:hypothetical protein